MIRLLASAVVIFGIVHAANAKTLQIANDQKTLQADIVHLRGLDTLNGTTEDIDIRSGETVRYGYLDIVADTCRVPNGNVSGDAYAFLRIRDIREDSQRFSGWMFASSPALSALDHPRYDVWVLSCSNN
jgi:hypothetical protein